LIALEFKKWNKVNKKVVTGLTRRRIHEANIYFS
jgi:GH24 family phage-related lysozyme (muramidase)